MTNDLAKLQERVRRIESAGENLYRAVKRPWNPGEVDHAIGIWSVVREERWESGSPGDHVPIEPSDGGEKPPPMSDAEELRMLRRLVVLYAQSQEEQTELHAGAVAAERALDRSKITEAGVACLLEAQFSEASAKLHAARAKIFRLGLELVLLGQAIRSGKPLGEPRP